MLFEHYVRRQHRTWLARGYVAGLALAGVLFAPLAMPILPPATFVSAYGFLTGVGNGGAGQSTAGAFPQYLGDRFGWDTLVGNMETVYARLSPEQRSQACILTANYGEASALTVLGPRDRLPPTISGHNNYYLWGPGACSGNVLITIGYSQSDMRQTYQSVVPAMTNICQYCMAEENDLPIYICTYPKHPGMRDMWLGAKHFD